MVLQKLDEASVVLGISPPLLHPPANTFSPGGRKKCSLIGMLDTLPATPSSFRFSSITWSGRNLGKAIGSICAVS